MPKHPLSFILCLLFSITFIAISPVQMAHADDLSQGMQLYRAKKYREAVPYLEKAAKEGHDEALKALDEIYADQTPAVDMTDSKAPATEGKAAGKTAGDDKPADTRAGAEKVPAPMYEKATVAEDPKFTLRGRDIIMPLPITVSQAVNGAKVTATDIDGNEIAFKVPAGSSSGAEVRIAGKGVANPHENGDLVGRVEIRIPEHPNLVAKHAAKEFDKACGDFADELARER